MTEQRQNSKAVIDQLIDQHNQIIAIIEKLSPLLGKIETDSNSIKARDLLEILYSLLDTHLKVEDKLLYPVLRQSSDQSVKKTAETYSEEMGNLFKDVNLYMRRWTTSSIIAADAEDFKKETKPLVWALLKRIDRENNGLFPLLK